ncbi:4'-phosphopantetheinyl transferase family protein [Donghicola mangrovi]|nr:4'-phosphopantetheinyl transferase superfamily protein [Donghicola mangrovi]
MTTDGTFVSISHTQGYVAAACSADGKIGVDLSGPEDLPHLTPAASFFLSSEEEGVSLNLPEHQRLEYLQKLWVLKEALLKGVGIGLGLDPRGLSFDCRGNEWRCHAAPRWRFDVREIAPGFVCGLAIKSQYARVEWHSSC